jgi:RNA polymerase sigma-70 factor (family 1)
MKMSAGYSPTEIEVFEKLSIGDSEAFKWIYDTYRARLYRFALKFLPSAEAEEVVQDIFLKLWENRLNHSIKYSLSAFLFTITRNHILNLLKKNNREAELIAEFQWQATRYIDSVFASENDTDQEKVAQHILEQLPAQRREVFKKVRIEGKSYKETSNELNISINTVSDHLTKANQVIKKLLTAYSHLLVLTIAHLVKLLLPEY